MKCREVVALSLTLILPCVCYADTREKTIIVSDEQIIKDIIDEQEAHKNMAKRRDLIAKSLFNLSNFDQVENRNETIKSIGRLGRLTSIESVPQLIKNLAFPRYLDINDVKRSDFPSPINLYPAVESLIMISEPAIPYIIDSLASNSLSPIESSNAIFTIQKIVGRNIHNPTQIKLKIFAAEYKAKANRLRILSKQSFDMDFSENGVDAITKQNQKTTKPTIQQLVRVLELRDIVIGNTTPIPDEKQVCLAIRELAGSHYENLISILVDKLDYELPLNTESVIAPEQLRAHPQGLLSPAITEEAQRALLEIGTPALPALVDAVSTSGRGPRFRKNALVLVAKILGCKNETHFREHLNKFAEETDAKSQRIFDLASEINY